MCVHFLLFYVFSFDVCSSDPLERRVIRKEYLSGAYPLSAYYLAKITTDFPSVLFYPGLIVFCSYFFTGLTLSIGNLLTYVGCFLLSAAAAQVRAATCVCVCVCVCISGRSKPVSNLVETRT